MKTVITNSGMDEIAQAVTPQVLSAVVIEPSMMGATPAQVMTLVEGIIAGMCLAVEQVGRQMTAESYAAMLMLGVPRRLEAAREAQRKAKEEGGSPP